MKKILIYSIIFFWSFSIENTVFSEWYIDELLEIHSGIEAFDIELVDIQYYRFQTPGIQHVYDSFLSVNDVLKNELMRKYREDNFAYYQMQGIIKNYKGFIYHTDKLFFYLSIKDNGLKGKEIDTAILRSYQNTRIYYTRMKNIIKRDY